MNGGNEDPRGTNLITYLNAVPGTNLPIAFDLIAPEEFGAMFDMSMGSAFVTARNIEWRVNELRADRGDHGGLSLADPHGRLLLAMQKPSGGGDSDWQPGLAAHMGSDNAAGQITQDDAAQSWAEHWNLFATGSGEVIDVGSTLDAAGYDIQSAGITVGADHPLDRNSAVGITLGYVGSKGNLVNGGRVDVNGGKAGVYAAWFAEHCYLGAALGGGYNYYDTRRVSLGGEARGNTTGVEFSGIVSGGCETTLRRLHLGTTMSVHTPTWALTRSRRQDRFPLCMLRTTRANPCIPGLASGRLTISRPARPQFIRSWD